MDYKQTDILKGFYAHCYTAYHGGGRLDAAFWAEQLDAHKIPWFIQNSVAIAAERRDSIALYFNTILQKILNDWDCIKANQKERRFILQAKNGAYFTGKTGAFICSNDARQAQKLTKEKALFLSRQAYFLDFAILETPTGESQ